MKSDIIPLAKAQREIMKEFYAISPTHVIFNKRERVQLWHSATHRKTFSEMESISRLCPALAHQILKSYESGNNIQSAVFSECVYAQTFANMFQLSFFVNCLENEGYIPHQVLMLLKSLNLFPRYAYGNVDKSRMLIQAGGCNGIDSALITVIDLAYYTIEFKEPGAKTSEPDLPKYKEDGMLIVTPGFLAKYPQFGDMLKEQQGLNFFSSMGNNIHNFSQESITTAVSNNYRNKEAHVICTEDLDGLLVMMPSNQVSVWAAIEGEIRPAGRNHYAVWTPKALQCFLAQKGATIKDGIVSVDRRKLEVRRKRGGGGIVSGYKINPLFFVYSKDCRVVGKRILFPLSKVQQLNPTIAGKMFFEQLHHSDVKMHYGF